MCIRDRYNLCIEGNSREAANNFRYLGDMMDNEEWMNTKIQDGIQIGNCAYCTINRLLTRKLINRNTNIKVHRRL